MDPVLNIPVASGTNSNQHYDVNNLITMSGNTVHGPVHVNITQAGHKDNKKPLSFGLPFYKEHIIGRESEVKELYQLLECPKHKPVVITGVGGAGKTALALHCIHTWSFSGQFKNTVFINAESLLTFRTSLIHLASKLKIKVDNMELRDILIEIITSYDDNILLIYDNIYAKAVYLDYLPNYRHVYILATSQLTELNAFFQCYAITVLNSADSELLIRNVLEVPDNIVLENISKLIELFEGLPLGLIQAAAFIQDKIKYENPNYTITDYILQYNEHLNEPFPDDFRINYKHSLFIAFKMNFDKLKNETTKNIMWCLAYLNPDYINSRMFYSEFGEEVKSSIRELSKYSLVKKYDTNNEDVILSIHRLLQEYCRFYYRSEKDRLLILVIKLTVMSNNFTEQFNFIVSNVDFISTITIFTEGFRQSLTSNKYISKQLQQLNIDMTVLDKWNAWHFAVYFGWADVLKEFHKRNLMFQTKHWSLLHIAAIAGSYYHIWSYVHIFLYALSYSDINMKTDKGLTAFHICAAFNSLDYTQILLKKGCDIDIIDDFGNTALHWMARSSENTVSGMNFLIDNGLDVTVCNNIGETGLDVFDNRIIVHKLNQTEFDCKYLSFVDSKKLIDTYIFKNVADGVKFVSNALQLKSNMSLLSELVAKVDNSVIALKAVVAHVAISNKTFEELLKILNIYDSVELQMFLKQIPNKHTNIFKIICSLFDFFKKYHPNKLDELIICSLTNELSENEYFDTDFLSDKLIKYILFIYGSHNKLYWLLEQLLGSDTSLQKIICMVDLKDFYLKQWKISVLFQSFVNSFNEICHVKNVEKWSVMHFACIDNRVGSVQIMLSLKELKVNVNEAVDNIYPIYLISSRSNYGSTQLDKLDILVDMGADVNVPTKEGLTLLHVAAMQGNDRLIMRLKFYKAMESTDSTGKTPRDYAMINKHQNVIVMLNLMK